MCFDGRVFVRPEFWKEAGRLMSAEKIIDKIIADANADAAKTLEKASQDGAERMALVRDEAEKRAARIDKKADADCAEIERRRMLTASLDVRKNSLASRRALVDRAFALALEGLFGLSDADYAALVVKMAVAAAEDGTEEIFVPVKDEKRYKGEKSILRLINQALEAAGKPGGLTLGGLSTDFVGGVRISGEYTDIDCSFESLVARFRENHERDVANILFESGV